MSCGACIRMRRLMNSPTFGFCLQPKGETAPYWRAAHPSGDLLVHQSHGAECAAFKPRRPA